MKNIYYISNLGVVSCNQEENTNRFEDENNQTLGAIESKNFDRSIK